MGKNERKFCKRKQKQQLVRMRSKLREKWLSIRNPDIWKINKEQLMNDVIAQNRKHSRALVLDIDGTLIEFTHGKRKHRAINFWPNYKQFIAEVQEFADLFLFSTMSITKLNRLWPKYFETDFSGRFDRRILSRFKKNLHPLVETGFDILLLDDLPEKIHERFHPFFIPIKRWEGNEDDNELLNALEVIRKRWNLFKTNSTI